MVKQLIFLLAFSGIIAGQSLQKDVFFLIKHRPNTSQINIKNESAPTPINIADANELKLLMVGLIRTYQVAISSQDKPSCVFHPSCSRFTSAAVQQGGLIKGTLLSFDRLQRCNGLPGSTSHHQFIPELGKFSDPLKNYLKEQEAKKTP